MLRILIRERGYTLLSALTLALAVGANLVVFTLANAIWLKPRGIPNADRVVAILGDTSNSGAGDSFAFAEAGIRRLEESQAFDVLAGQVLTTGHQGAYLVRLDMPRVGRPVENLGVTWRYFAALDVAVRGRAFVETDDRFGAEPVAIISDRLWRSAFQSRFDIIGQVVEATPRPVRIIGVAPPSFEGARLGEHVDVWLPSNLVATWADAGGQQGSAPLMAIGRLKRDVSLPAAQRALDDQRHGRGFAYTAVPLARIFGSPDHGTKIVQESEVLGAIGITAAIVLLAGCVTLMALVTVHYEKRRQEFAVRLALGASRVRLVKALAAELGVLVAIGAIGAAVAAAAGLRSLPALNLPGGVDLSRLDLSLDPRVFGVAIAITLLTIVLASLLPLARVGQGNPAMSLVTARATATASSLRLRRVMLAVHVAATVMVLVAAGLFVRTIVYGFTQGAGFDADRTLFVEVQARAPYWGTRTPDPAREVAALERQQRARALEAALIVLPGVEAVARGTAPIGADQARAILNPRPLAIGDEDRPTRLGIVSATANYLDAIGVAIVAGEGLTDEDSRPFSNPPAGVQPIVVTRALADALWPGESPIGREVSLDGSYRMRVKGVSADVRYGSMRMDRPMLVQARRLDVPEMSVFDFVLRTGTPAALVGDVSRLISQQFPDAMRTDVVTGREVLARDLGRERLGAIFFSGFGLVALLLGVGGVFGMVAYLAESRRRDLGVRMALGASAQQLMRSAVGTAMVPVACGVAAGLVGASFLARALDSFLLGVGRLDPITYVSMATFTLCLAAVAGLLAAWRIRRVSPLDALRADG